MDKASTNPEGLAQAKTPLHILAGVFFLSGAVLMLEVLESRIFAFILWHHLGFMVISIAMLGLSAAGTYLALRSGSIVARPGRVFTISALGFALSLLLGHAVISRLGLDLTPRLVPALFALYLLCFLPFAAAGMGLALPFRLYPGDSARIYAASMVGSGAGTLVVLAALSGLGAERALALVAAVGAVAGFCLAGPRPATGKVLARWLLVIAAFLVLIPFAPRLFSFKTFQSKLMGLYMKQNPQAKLEATGWTPFCRIDVVGLGDDRIQFGEPLRVKIVFQDGDEPTSILGFDDQTNLSDLAERSPYAAGYLIEPKPQKMLIIGSGGGLEARLALHHGAPDITCVEINPYTIAQVKGPYAAWTGDVYNHPSVHLVNAEGRSFLSRSTETYDLITLNAVDTYTSLASGAYVLTESYLYTEEAMGAYLDHLDEGGAIAFYRLQQNPPRETLRLVMVMLRALEKRGAARPWDHIILLDRQTTFNMIVGKNPFTPAELDRFRLRFDALNQKVQINDPFSNVKVDDSLWTLLYTPDAPGADTYSRYLVAVAQGQEKTFFNLYPYIDGARITDDSPYFFKYSLWDFFYRKPSLQWGALLILFQIVQTGLLTLVLIVLPLRRLPRATVGGAERLRALAYFIALGAGYLLVEIVLMQKLVLLLGNPAYSLTITLSSLLVSSGVGAIWIERRRGWSGRAGALAVVVALVGLLLIAPPVVRIFLGQGMALRLMAAGLLILPVGFLMGTPFPAGLKAASRIYPDLVPWAWSVNGAASVMASIICVPLAMNANFTVVLILATALYAVAAAVGVFAQRE